MQIKVLLAHMNVAVQEGKSSADGSAEWSQAVHRSYSCPLPLLWVEISFYNLICFHVIAY